MSYNVRYALVRDLANTFQSALRQDAHGESIDVRKAKLQHEAYSAALKELVPELCVVPGSDDHPDSCFIEDTAIVFGQDVVITRIGAESRRQESEAVNECFVALQKRDRNLRIHRLEAPATLDGGDVLVMGGHLFVGLSQRTNSAAFEQLSRLFPARVFAIPVAAGLHLKSVLSAIDEDTLLVAGNAAARAMGQRILASFSPNHQKQMVEVPDAVAANVVRVGQTLLIQDAYPRSEHILLELAKSLSLSCVKLEMSELIKADGALTCCSILVY